MALKIGLSGSASVAVADEADAARVRSGAENAGALIDLHVTSLESLPFENDAFDIVVVHGVNGLLQSLNERARAESGAARSPARAQTRGRIIVIEAGPKSGLAGIIQSIPAGRRVRSGRRHSRRSPGGRVQTGAGVVGAGGLSVLRGTQDVMDS